MHTIRAREYRRAFRVNSWDIERLVDLLGGDEKIRAIVVEFGDGSSTTLQHAGELAELPNPASRPIRRVWFESHPPAFLVQSDEMPRLTIVELQDGAAFGVAVHVSGDEKAVRDQSLQLERWANSISPWYGALAYVDRILLAGGALLLLGTIASVGMLLGLLIAGSSLLDAWQTLPTLGVPARVAAGVGLALLAGTLVRVGSSPRRYFPRAEFRFGQGEERFRRTDRRRGRTLGATAAVALITTLAATIASALM